MKTAYSYARVSSKEQQEKKNSIPEQQRRINDYAKNNNISIIQSFTDSSSAFHDENRVNFEKMVEQAIKNKPNYIILDDSSRFARTRNVAIETKQLLRSHGIDILYASESNIDTNTVAGFWYEGIKEIKNEATSREISFHTKKGMTGNLQHRDTETGWCYKNGGKAPYGYKRELLYRGIGSKGKPIYKTIWKINEETAPVVRKIIVELYTNGEKSYNYIRDYLNNNHIPNSNGGLWSTSTISSMLKEDRLQEYAGVAIWNKENNNIVGVKYNPKELWTICENAHPAIITKEELSLALERKNNARNSQYQYNPSSDYLLSGKNFENKFLFTCSECGGHVCGCSSGRKHIKKYACSTNNHRGICACSNNLKIDKDWLEETVINIIEQNYLIKEKINKKIDQLYDELKNRNSIYDTELKNIDKQISSLDTQIQNLVNSIKQGVISELIVPEINNLKKDKDELLAKRENVLNSMQDAPKIKKEDIRKYFYNFRKIFISATTDEKKELIKTFISNITFNKKEHHIEISLYQYGFAVLEQVAGIEPA